MFVTRYDEILELIDRVDPVQYGKTRNYLNGAVTKLSPYISRGVISTKFVAQKVLAKGYKPYQIEQFLKELGWRDFFQQVWRHINNDIFNDIKQTQPDVRNRRISKAIIQAQTGIIAIDKGIKDLMQTGYMHNHLRMYTASVACNIAKSHWLMPAQWLYYHLLDADWASNALSWQWVAQSFSGKKYYANQENINKYCNTNQTNSFLDIGYDEFENIEIPPTLMELTDFNIKTTLPVKQPLIVDASKPTVLYTFYNLDPVWLSDLDANRILILEPSFFEKYPVCDNTINFILALSKNIKDVQIFVGEFTQLQNNYNLNNFHFKEHPTNLHFKGKEYSRDWLSQNAVGMFNSFFAYWKKAEKEIMK